jgi:hypothetical protein
LATINGQGGSILKREKNLLNTFIRKGKDPDPEPYPDPYL